MQTYELDAWLGDFEAELDDEKKAELGRALDRIAERYPEDGDERGHAAAVAATQVAFGDETLDGLAEAWRASKIAERAAMAALTGAMLVADEAGESEAAIVKASGINRMTVRKALGK